MLDPRIVQQTTIDIDCNCPLSGAIKRRKSGRIGRNCQPARAPAAKKQPILPWGTAVDAGNRYLPEYRSTIWCTSWLRRIVWKCLIAVASLETGSRDSPISISKWIFPPPAHNVHLVLLEVVNGGNSQLPARDNRDLDLANKSKRETLPMLPLANGLDILTHFFVEIKKKIVHWATVYL